MECKHVVTMAKCFYTGTMLYRCLPVLNVPDYLKLSREHLINKCTALYEAITPQTKRHNIVWASSHVNGYLAGMPLDLKLKFRDTYQLEYQTSPTQDGKLIIKRITKVRAYIKHKYKFTDKMHQDVNNKQFNQIDYIVAQENFPKIEFAGWTQSESML